MIPGLNIYVDASKGWECPRCHKVSAPWVASCDCHKGLAPAAAPTTVEWERTDGGGPGVLRVGPGTANPLPPGTFTTSDA